MDTWTILFIVVIAVALIILGLFIWNELRFKHRVKIREVTSKGRSFIIEDKARDYTDGRNTYWRLKKERDKIKRNMPVPPSEAIDMTKRGKKYVEVFRTPVGEYIYLKVGDTENKEPIHPLTTNQKSALIDQIVKAEERKHTDWKQQIPAFVFSGAIVIILVMGMIFLPDIITTYTKGATQVSDSMKEYEAVRHRNLMKEMEQWDKVTEGLQTIETIQLENQKKLSELEQNNP